jgi:hypothetical protein
MNIEDLENEVQKISKEEIKMRLRRLGINFEKEDEPKEYYVNLYKKAYDLKTSQSNQNTNKTNNQFSFRNLLNNHSLHLYKPEETKDNIKQNNEMKRIFNLSKNYNQPENQINYSPIYNDSNTLFKTERREKKIFKDKYLEKEIEEDSEGEIIDYIYNEGNYNNNLSQSGIKTISVIRINDNDKKDNDNLLNKKIIFNIEKREREDKNNEKKDDVKNSQLNNQNRNYNLINSNDELLRDYYNNISQGVNNNNRNNNLSNNELKNLNNENIRFSNESNNYGEQINNLENNFGNKNNNYLNEYNNYNLLNSINNNETPNNNNLNNNYNDNYNYSNYNNNQFNDGNKNDLNQDFYNNYNNNQNDMNNFNINNNFNDFNRNDNQWSNNYIKSNNSNQINNNYENQQWQNNQSNYHNSKYNNQSNFQNPNYFNQTNIQNSNFYNNNNINNPSNYNNNFSNNMNYQNEINTSNRNNIMNLNSDDIMRKYFSDNKEECNYMNSEKILVNKTIKNKYHSTSDKNIPPQKNKNNNQTYFHNPNIHLETSIQNTVINDIHFNSNIPFNPKINMKRNYLKISSIIILLTIISFIISWYFLKNNGTVNNINICITSLMFLLLLYQIIKYIKMVKYYNKIAEKDYKILKERLQFLKLNNNNEQWIKMDDFIENAILRNNMFKNDYISNVLPRLRDLIMNEQIIKEQEYYNEGHEKQIIWCEI